MRLAPGSDRDDDADRVLLEWAARLAEAGLSIAHAQYHKHSAYVLSNADMPGFSRMEQARLARLVLAHRGKLAKMQDAGLRRRRLEAGVRAAHRLAHPAQPHRREAAVPARRRRRARGFAIDLPQSWLDDNALSAAALDAEADQWKKVGMKLEVSGLSDKKVSVLSRSGESRSGEITARTSTGCASSNHHKPPFLRLQPATDAAEVGGRVPRSGWCPTTITVPSPSGQPAACRIFFTDAPGASCIDGLDLHAQSLGGLLSARGRAGQDHEIVAAGARAAIRPRARPACALSWSERRSRSGAPSSASACRQRISSMALV